MHLLGQMQFRSARNLLFLTGESQEEYVEKCRTHFQLPQAPK